MDLMEARRRLMGQMASSNNVQSGTFLGNGRAVVQIPCSFEPDAIVVWCDDLRTNPGISGGCFINGAWMKGHGNTTLRWTNGTNVNPSGSGGTDARGIGNYYSSYSNGVLNLASGSGGSSSFFYANNYEYSYILVKS